MKLFHAPTHLDENKPTIDLAALHEQVLTLVGLAALLLLQQGHEGHMDGHVTVLFLDILHKIELELSNVLDEPELDDLPF